jgi:hypothetical protein
MYEVDMQMLTDNGGSVAGISTHPELVDFVVQLVPGTNLVIVMIRSSSQDSTNVVKKRKDYCGVFSTMCSSLLAPWPADLGENVGLSDLANECNSNAGAVLLRGTRTCPVLASRIVDELWSFNLSSALGNHLSDLRERSGQEECKSWLQKNVNYIILLSVACFFGAMLLVGIRMQAASLARQSLEETKRYRDVLHQPVKEIQDCAMLLRDECHRVIAAARCVSE